MSSFPQIGSQIELVFQTTFSTFTPDQLMKSLKERDYTVTQGTATDRRNPNAPPIIIPAFSKDNISVLFNPAQTQLVFQILNTVDISKILKEVIQPILISLKIIESVIASISFSCTTSVPSVGEPQKNMTNLFKMEFLNSIKNMMEAELKPSSIRLTTEIQPGNDLLQVLLEPLSTNPHDQYFLNISFKTMKEKNFNNFIGRFGSKMIEEIIKEVQGHSV